MLITLEEYKLYKNIATSETDYDSQIEELIKSSVSFIKRYCGRLLEIDTVQEKFDATQKEFYLREYPVVSVSKVETSEDGVNFEELDPEDYIVILEEDLILSTKGAFIRTAEFPRISGRVTYQAGFTEVPHDLKLAVAHLVDYFKENDYKPNKAFQGTNIENPGSIMGNQLPNHIKRVLDLYRAL